LNSSGHIDSIKRRIYLRISDPPISLNNFDNYDSDCDSDDPDDSNNLQLKDISMEPCEPIIVVRLQLGDCRSILLYLIKKGLICEYRTFTISDYNFRERGHPLSSVTLDFKC